MSFEAKILADSISPVGVRLTTLEVTMPRIVLAEYNTHRVFSRSSASSRAIPVEKRIAAVRENPFIPSAFGRNQKGMQAGEALTGKAAEDAEYAWLSAARAACHWAGELSKADVHKQYANRLLEPFLWHTVICSSTEWSNFWGLRISPLAQPEIAEPARLMKAAMDASVPVALEEGRWHTPLVPDLADLEKTYTLEEILKVSAARCARVSYLTHDGVRDVAADLALFERLVSSGHMSPLEHVATATPTKKFIGNFRGWHQLRKFQTLEDDFSARMNPSGDSGTP
jgi:thymidylate synthase ThyX